jgi:hypothetical protein
LLVGNFTLGSVVLCAFDFRSCLGDFELDELKLRADADASQPGIHLANSLQGVPDLVECIL